VAEATTSDSVYGKVWLVGVSGVNTYLLFLVVNESIMVNDALPLCSIWCYGVVMCILLCSVVTPS